MANIVVASLQIIPLGDEVKCVEALKNPWLSLNKAVCIIVTKV